MPAVSPRSSCSVPIMRPGRGKPRGWSPMSPDGRSPRATRQRSLSRSGPASSTSFPPPRWDGSATPCGKGSGRWWPRPPSVPGPHRSPRLLPRDLPHPGQVASPTRGPILRQSARAPPRPRPSTSHLPSDHHFPLVLHNALLPHVSRRLDRHIRCTPPFVRPRSLVVHRATPSEYHMVTFLKGRRKTDDAVVAVDSSGAHITVALETLVARAETALEQL